MTRLSVNLNKIALLRNARGEDQPDLATAARTCIEAGCDGITVHPRPDQRHIRPADVGLLSALTREAGVEFNIEGNPFAPPRGAYPGLVSLCRETRPDQVTLVPDSDAQLTSDHGFDPAVDSEVLSPLVSQLLDCCGRVSLFVDVAARDLARFAALGAHRVELYTGPYAEAFASGNAAVALQQCAFTARAAREAGLVVNAGHDLDQQNLGPLLDAIPDIAEVSIGHALIGEALYDGLASTVQAYVAITGKARQA
ncbi:MAG: pyridoxine 5'-phosphate synthase [Rhodanobacteraceae bacterium]